MEEFEAALYKYFEAEQSEVIKILEKGEKLDKENQDKLREALSEFKLMGVEPRTPQN